MKAQVYMRLARNPGGRTSFKVAASPTPNHSPLTIGSSGYERHLHTLQFALVLDVPDELLRPSGWPVIEVELDPLLTERLPIEVEPADA